MAAVGLAAGFAGFLLRRDARGDQHIRDIRVGDCFDEHADLATSRGMLLVVSCSGPHLGQTVLNQSLPEAGEQTYPGAEALHDDAVTMCGPAFEDYVGLTARQSEYTVIFFTPNDQAWSNPGDHRVLCAAANQDHSEMDGGSVRGTKR